MKLITVTTAGDVAPEVKSAAEVWPIWDSEGHPCEPPGSGKFPFDYGKQEERVLVICGKAVLTPSDGTDAVTISAGDFVKFHKGFSCRWHVLAPMKKHYCYFDEDGNEAKCAGGVSCDRCSKECTAESFLMDDTEDLCPECFAAERCSYKLAQRCVDGQPVGKALPTSAKSKKKSASEKAVAPRKTTQTKTRK